VVDSSPFSNKETELNHLWRDFLRSYPQADPVHHPNACKYYAMLYFYYRDKTTDSRKSSENNS
jgi:hypothetical protein